MTEERESTSRRKGKWPTRLSLVIIRYEVDFADFSCAFGLRLLSPDALQALRSSLHCSCCFQGPCRSRRRERCAAPPTLVLDTSGAAAQASTRRPCFLGPAISPLEWLERKSGGGEASHSFGLASKGLQTLLAVEESEAWSRTTSNPHRSSKADHPDGRDECRLGGSPNSR